MPCELLEFSPHGVLLYFSFSRISSAVISDDSRCSGTVLATLGMGHRIIPHNLYMFNPKDVIDYSGHQRTRTFNLPLHKHTPTQAMCL